MNEILKSKGIISFFVFVVIMGLVSANNINSMKNSENIDNIVVMNDITK